MKICVLLPGKIKPKALVSAQEEYAKRLRDFGVEVAEYKAEKVSARTPEQTKQAEAIRIFKLLKEGDYLIACDERGQKIHTRGMAELLKASRICPVNPAKHVTVSRRKCDAFELTLF